MGVSAWLTLAGSGLVVGFVSGLVGIGGGVLTVPLLYFIYAHPSWSGVQVAPELQAVVAHATSLLVIVPTALAGTAAYHRRGAVAWRAALPIAATSIFAALAVSRVAPLIPEGALKLGFGALLLVSGTRLLQSGFAGRRSEGQGAPTGADGAKATDRVAMAGGPREPSSRVSRGGGARGRSRLLLAGLGGVGVGVLSALLGVGGGIVAIPVLVYVLRLDLSRVAATSMAVILFTAAAGVLGYATAAVPGEGIPAGSFGYVHLAAALPIVVGSTVAVRSGAIVNQRMGARRLTLLFGALFLLLGGELAIRSAAALLRLF